LIYVNASGRFVAKISVLAAGLKIMNRNVLYIVIGALAVIAGVVSYQLDRERQKSSGIEINVGKGGISIEKK
jgi:hypothetical protein